jgi:hypothetical protein
MNARSRDSWSRLAQRMACIILGLTYRELDRPSITSFTSAIYIGMARGASASIQKSVENMLNHGSRYLNIETNLGYSICFVLEGDLPESQ